MSSTVTVHLHGYLGNFHQGPISLVVNTVAEAIESITNQLPGFSPHPKHGRHRIAVVDHTTERDFYGPLKTNEIHIVPQFIGGKNKSAFIQIGIGVALVAASFIPGVGPMLAGLAFNLGAALILGGISQLLFPVPDSEDTKNKSRYLGAPKNTVGNGTRIPILYGEHQSYGHILSFDVQALNKSVET